MERAPTDSARIVAAAHLSAGGGGFPWEPQRAGPGAGGVGWGLWSMRHDGAASPRAPPVPGTGLTLADDPELLLSLLRHAPAAQCLTRLDLWAWRGVPVEKSPLRGGTKWQGASPAPARLFCLR